MAIYQSTLAKTTAHEQALVRPYVLPANIKRHLPAGSNTVECADDHTPPQLHPEKPAKR